MYSKAQISGFDRNKRKRVGRPMDVCFNPSSYSITFTNHFDINADSKSGEKPMWFTFLEKGVSVMSVELLFDTYRENEPDEKQKDVRENFALLQQHMKVEPEEHSPRMLLFSWGTTHFGGVLTRLEENYTMFAGNGTPVRAKVQISISGAPISDANKPNQSPDRTKLYTVSQNDTLWEIAEREYGSCGEWRPIADANQIHNPRNLKQAGRLVLPALPGGKAD